MHTDLTNLMADISLSTHSFRCRACDGPAWEDLRCGVDDLGGLSAWPKDDMNGRPNMS
jgi:hypothetical protein